MTSVMSSFSMMMHQSFKADMCLKMNLCFSIHFFLASYPSSTSTSRLRNCRTVIWGFCCPKDWEENKHTLTLRHECWRLTRIDLNTKESLDGRNAQEPVGLKSSGNIVNLISELYLPVWNHTPYTLRILTILAYYIVHHPSMITIMGLM